MKGIKTGWWIASGVVLILSVVCLCGGDPQAFLGGVIVAGIVLAVGRAKSKKPSPKTVERRADSAAQNRPPVSPVSITPDLDSSSSSSFGCWDVSIHGADGQDVRMDRALFQNIVIQSYDPSTGSAEILGTRGEVYKTSLDHCSCEDFRRRGLPCKHIYKLALSRGYTADAFFSARSDVVWYADGCRVYHVKPDCRGLRNRYSRRSTVSMAEYNGLHPCKSCCGNK
jgi:hypothetical protein